jgi:hypothetical protein
MMVKAFAQIDMEEMTPFQHNNESRLTMTSGHLEITPP